MRHAGCRIEARQPAVRLPSAMLIGYSTTSGVYNYITAQFVYVGAKITRSSASRFILACLRATTQELERGTPSDS